MDFPQLLIKTKSPVEPKADWIKQGLNQHNCCFIGYISNAKALQQQLNLNLDGELNQQAMEQLVCAAIQRWGYKVNQYLFGDYNIVWFDENEQHLGITASARSSFSLFYTLQRQANDPIEVAFDLKKLHREDNVLNPIHWLQQVSLGPLIGRHTYLNNIRRLQPGETIIWNMTEYKCCHQVKLESEQQLKFADNALSSCFDNSPTICFEHQQQEQQTSTLALFNQLPQIAHHLGEPIHDALLAHFDQQISQCEHTWVKLDESWFSGRLNVTQAPITGQKFDSKIIWQKSILRDSLLKFRRKVSHRQDYLFTSFEAVSAEKNHDQLTFATWLDLHFVIPAWCQLYQRIANKYGKVIINPYIKAENALAMINKQQTSEKGFFNLEDESLCNVYDAMQRLFRNGEQATKKWFDLKPAVTAGFIKQREQYPRLVEQTSIAMLTFDYLAKFHNNHIDSEISV